MATEVELPQIPFKTVLCRYTISPDFYLDIEGFKKSQQDSGAAKGTINSELAVLSHLFSKAVGWKWLNHKPATIKRLKGTSKNSDFFVTGVCSCKTSIHAIPGNKCKRSDVSEAPRGRLHGCGGSALRR
jgi:hypothetical protein